MTERAVDARSDQGPASNRTERRRPELLHLPARPPFALRARLLSPLTAGGFLDEPDGLLIVDADGHITWAGRAHERPGRIPEDTLDVRPHLLLPGLVDLHGHLPQVPISGVGFDIRILDWLTELMEPVERAFDRDASRRLSPLYFRLFASAGTTTACLYTSVDAGATHAAFEAAEEHGMRVIMGQPLMDLGRYDRDILDHEVTGVRLQEAAETCERWHGRDGGRLLYAFTPRGALKNSAKLMAESARLAKESGAYWQTHLAEDRDEVAAVAQVHPDAVDNLDVYDRAGGLGPKSILAHVVHVSDREIARIRDTETVVAHCPSNVWLGGGIMRLAYYRERGLRVGLGSDVGGSMGLSMWVAMQVGALSQNARGILLGDSEHDVRGHLATLDWLRLATLDGARTLGLGHVIGSLEASKDADIILVDSALTSPISGDPIADVADASALVSRLIFRPHPEMVQGAWVRGRRLPSVSMEDSRTRPTSA